VADFLAFLSRRRGAATARFAAAPYDPAFLPLPVRYTPISAPAAGERLAGRRSLARPETPASPRPCATTPLPSHGSSTAPPWPANPCTHCIHAAPKNSLARPPPCPMLPGRRGGFLFGHRLPRAAVSRGAALPLTRSPLRPAAIVVTGALAVVAAPATTCRLARITAGCHPTRPQTCADAASPRYSLEPRASAGRSRCPRVPSHA
jgi:hypothetical protein